MRHVIVSMRPWLQKSGDGVPYAKHGELGEPSLRTVLLANRASTMTSHNEASSSSPVVSLADFQRLIREMYFEKDEARGIDGTFMWLMEEVGELAAALRSGSHEGKMEEFADVLAWLTTIANVANVDLSEAVTRKYGSGCPGCGRFGPRP